MNTDSVLEFFKEISKIPRGSFNESGIADYLCRFAKERGLFCYRDVLNNVFIRKNASPGMENFPSVLLQGHTDMVCEKNEQTIHDFEKDGIKLIIEGDKIRGDGTTLGADNGAAVAMMLSVLDDNSMKLPGIECLFTVCEEVGLQGAAGFDCSLINSRTMINLDSSTESEVTVSCAGGVKSLISVPLGKTRPADADKMPLVSVFVSGLFGGHSGLDINLRRGNANKIACHILLKILDRHNVYLLSINGGNKDNAIPRECSFVISAHKDDIDSVRNIVESEARAIETNLASPEDGGFDVRVCTLCESGKTYTAASLEKTKLTAELMNAVPDGVTAMSTVIDGMVETSVNAGVIRTDGDTLKITCSPRSSSEFQLDCIMRKLESLAFLASGEISHAGRYPGWEAAESSKIREKYITEFEKLNGYKPKILAVHAGLECGLIKSKIPEMDIISIGPDMEGIHTPEETMSISSLGRIYSLLTSVLKSES